MQFSILYNCFKAIGNSYNLKIIDKGTFIIYLLKKPDIDPRTGERYYQKNRVNNRKVIHHFIKTPIADYKDFIKSIFHISDIPASLMTSCNTAIRDLYHTITSQPVKETLSESILLERCIHYIMFGGIYDSYFLCSLNKVPVFYGRDKEIESIKTLMNNNNIVFIKGMAGIGKTQCILEYTSRFHTQYRNIAFGQSSISVQDALRSILFDKSCSDFYSQDHRHAYERLSCLLHLLSYDNLIVLECDQITKEDMAIIDTLSELEVKILIATRHIDYLKPYPSIKISELDSQSLHSMLNTIYSEGETQAKNPHNTTNESLSNEDAEKIIKICHRHTLFVSLTAHLLHLKPDIKEELLNITSLSSFSGFSRIKHKYDNDQIVITSHIANMLFRSCHGEYDLNDAAILSLFTPVPVSIDALNKWGFNNFDNLISHGIIELSESPDSCTYIYMHPLISDALWSIAQLTSKDIIDKIDAFITYLTWGNEKITEYTTIYAIIDLIVRRITPKIKSFHNPNQKKASRNIQQWWYTLEKLLIFELESGATAKVDTITKRIFKVDDHQRTTKNTRPSTPYNLLINDRQKLFLDICQFYTLLLNGQKSDTKALTDLMINLLNEPFSTDYDLHWYYCTIGLDLGIRYTYKHYIDLICPDETYSSANTATDTTIKEIYNLLIQRIDSIFLKMNIDERNAHAVELAYYHSAIPLINGSGTHPTYYLISLSDTVYFSDKFCDTLNRSCTEPFFSCLPMAKTDNAILRMKINTNYILVYLLSEFEHIANAKGHYYPDNARIDVYKTLVNNLSKYHQDKIWPIFINDNFTITMYLFFALNRDLNSAIKYGNDILLNAEQLDLTTPNEKDTRINTHKIITRELLKRKEPYLNEQTDIEPTT